LVGTNDDTFTGAVSNFLYDEGSDQWIENKQIIPDDIGAGSSFGGVLSLSNEIVDPISKNPIEMTPRNTPMENRN